MRNAVTLALTIVVASGLSGCASSARGVADRPAEDMYMQTPGAHSERPGKHSTTVGRHGSSGTVGGGPDTQSGASSATEERDERDR
jgi:hypothetical protein